MAMPTTYRKFEIKCELLEDKLTLVSNHEAINEEDKLMQNFLKKVLENTRVEMDKFQISQLALKKGMQKENQLLTAAPGQQQNWGDGDGNATLRFDKLPDEANINAKLRFDKLPDELLEMILNKLEHFKDLEHCSRASSSFKRILDGKIPVWKLHRILHHIEKYVDSNAIATCRKVCRHWKIQVDEYLGSLLLPSLNWNSVWNKITWKKRSRLLHMMTTVVPLTGQFRSDTQFYQNKWQALTNEARPIDSSFYSKHLWIYCPYDTDYLCGIKNVKFLQCSVFIFNVRRYDSIEVLRRVSAYLSHLPNIKALTLWFGDNCGEKRYIAPNIVEVANPLPKLPHLKEIECLDAPPPMSQFVFQTYAHQLEDLKVLDYDFEAGLESTPEILSSGLKNLIGFQINVTIPDWKVLEKLALLKSPLKKLTISLAYELNLAEILPALQLFEHTLETVHINLPRAYSHYNKVPSPDCVNNHLTILEISTRLYLPKVKSLVLRSYFGSLDFLLCLPFLKYLNIMWDYKDGYWTLCTNPRNEEIVEIYGFHDRMYKSNIWTLFPFLKEYTYRQDDLGAHPSYPIHCFTREKHEYLQLQTMEL